MCQQYTHAMKPFLILLCLLIILHHQSSCFVQLQNHIRVRFSLLKEQQSSDLQQQTSHRRRARYNGSYPREYSQKYKELRGDEDVIAKVISKGSTPAGTHIPIMLKECIDYIGLSSSYSNTSSINVVDATLGYGGHSSSILNQLITKWNQSDEWHKSSLTYELIALDQDENEIIKTQGRLMEKYAERLDATHGYVRLTIVHRNFEHLYTYLQSRNLLGSIHSLLVDLGVSSMQIDNRERGFT